jgi:NAD(P)-dependent dehydrogenase (short-subunit alcohol dehydrogenase family)
MTRFGLAGKRVVITGGTSGIGKAVARRFAEEGASVGIVGRREDGAAVAREVGATFIRADIASEDGIRIVLRQASEVFGDLDVLVLNAGIDPGLAPMSEVDSDSFERNLAVNYRHVWWGLAHGPAHLADGASIIVTSSTVAVYKVPNISHYAAAKEAVVSLTKSAALELAHRGIRANAVLPGTTLSEMTPPDHWELAVMKTMLPMGRHADADTDLVGLYQFLASDESRYITGQAIAADGGMTLGMSYGTLTALGAPEELMSPSNRDRRHSDG